MADWARRSARSVSPRAAAARASITRAAGSAGAATGAAVRVVPAGRLAAGRAMTGDFLGAACATAGSSSNRARMESRAFIGGTLTGLTASNHASDAAGQGGGIKAVSSGAGRRGFEIVGRMGEAGMPKQEGGNPVLILAGQHRAGGIDQPGSEPRRLVQQMILKPLKLGQPRRRQPPFGLGLPPPSARTAARSVDKDQVEGSG